MNYNYTVEQVEKAIANKELADAKKLLAIASRDKAIKWGKEINMPYRIALDYLKNKKRDLMEVEINEWYPLPKKPLCAELTDEERINYRELELKKNNIWLESITEPTGETKDGQKVMRFCKCKDEKYLCEQEQIEKRATEKAKPYRLWDLETNEGLEKWEKYFALFIVPYESKIETWGSFEMFGDQNHDDKVVESRKAYYLDLIKRFKEDKDGYFDKKPQKKKVSDYGLYDFEKSLLPMDGFYMWSKDYNIKSHPDALEILKNELNLYERSTEKHDYRNEWIVDKIKNLIDELETESR